MLADKRCTQVRGKAWCGGGVGLGQELGGVDGGESAGGRQLGRGEGHISLL
jgi:hypothetical protein